MKKTKFLALLLAMAMLITCGLAACGDTGASSVAESAPAPAEESAVAEAPASDDAAPAAPTNDVVAR